MAKFQWLRLHSGLLLLPTTASGSIVVRAATQESVSQPSGIKNYPLKAANGTKGLGQQGAAIDIKGAASHVTVGQGQQNCAGNLFRLTGAVNRQVLRHLG